MGGSQGAPDDATKAMASLTESFKRLGMSESAAAGAAAGRAN